MATKKKDTNLPLVDLMAEYLTDCQNKNLSPATLESYAHTLKDFQNRTGAKSLGDVTPAVVSAYQTERGASMDAYKGSWHPVENRPLSAHSLHRIARTLRAFGRWLDRQGHGNPFCRLVMPKLPQDIVSPLTSDEIGQLFSIWSPDTEFGCRWQAMLSFFLDTGVRVGEMAGLTLDNLDMANYRAKVRGKGSKDRFVFFGNRTHRLLSKYLHTMRADVSPKVFVSVDGEGLTVNGIQQIVKRAAKKSGVGRLHCHLLRHTFASRYVERNQGDVFGLQTLLGHTSLSISQKYVHLSQTASIPATRRVSLLDDLEGSEALSFSRRRGQKTEKAHQRQSSADR